MNIIICGGGTAGHLTPAMAIYDEAINNNHNVTLIISQKDKHIVPSEYYNYHTLKLSSPINLKRKIIFMFQFCFAFISSIKYIKKYKADIIIGMGGFVSLPTLICGLFMRKKIFLCEQNSIPGKVNKLMAKYATSIYVTFSKSLEYFPKANVFGNPVRSGFFKITKHDARQKLKIKDNDKVLIVMGGSQGAKKINEMFLESLETITKEIDNINIYWLCGPLWAKHFQDCIDEKGYKNIHIFDYYNDMPSLLWAADFAISRAGSSTISEIIVAALPSLLIPFPYASENHQYFNAKELSDVNASLLMEEKDITLDTLQSIIVENMADDRLQNNMKENMKNLGANMAAKNILNSIENIVNK